MKRRKIVEECNGGMGGGVWGSLLKMDFYKLDTEVLIRIADTNN